MPRLAAFFVMACSNLLAIPASAHGVAGPSDQINRSAKDPAAADIVLLPALASPPAKSGQDADDMSNFALERNETISQGVAFAIADGYGWPPVGAETSGAVATLSIPLPYRRCTDADRDILLSLGVLHTVAGDALTPLVEYAGSRMVTGAVGSQFVDQRLKSIQAIDLDSGVGVFNFGDGTEYRWTREPIVQYGFVFLPARPEEPGRLMFVGGPTPLTGFAWSSSASKPHPPGKQCPSTSSLYFKDPLADWFGKPAQGR